MKITFLICVLSLYHLSVFGNANSEAEVEAHKEFNSLNYQRAIKLFNKSIEENPNRVSSLLGRSNCYKRLGLYDSALVDMRHILSIDSANWKVYLSLANLEHQIGAYQESIDHYKKGIAVSPNWDSYLGCWRSYSKLNKLNEAIKYLDASIKNSHSIVPKHCFNFAVLMLRQKRFDLALDHFILGVDNGGSSYQYHIDKDFRYLNINIHENEFREYILGTDSRLNKRDANYYLARIYNLLDNQKQAVAILEKLHENDPMDLVVHQDLGYSYLLAEDFKKAIRVFSRCIKTIEKNPNVYCNRGIAYLKTGDADLALLDLSKAVTLDGENSWAYYYRGIANLELKKYSAAYADFSTSIKSGRLLKSQEADVLSLLQKQFKEIGW